MKAVITGASSGIGKELVLHLLSSGGWEVCMVSRSTEKMQEIASQYPSEASHIITADLSDNAQSEQACADILTWADGNLSLLVNNAGAGIKGSTLANSSIEQFESQIRLNLTAVFIFTKLLSPLLAATASRAQASDLKYSGSIVNIGSIAAVGQNSISPSLSVFSFSLSLSLSLLLLFLIIYV